MSQTPEDGIELALIQKEYANEPSRFTFGGFVYEMLEELAKL